MSWVAVVLAVVMISVISWLVVVWTGRVVARRRINREIAAWVDGHTQPEEF